MRTPPLLTVRDHPSSRFPERAAAPRDLVPLAGGLVACFRPLETAHLARVIGHRQVTESHLVALAVHHGGRVATLDKGLAALHGPNVHLLTVRGPPSATAAERIGVKERARAVRARGGEAAMIIHDFVTIDRPVGEVVEQFTHLSESTLGVLVRSAWNDNRDMWEALGLPVPPPTADGPPKVTLGTARQRGDAVVTPHTWQADDTCPCFPYLDADLELAAFGSATQVHLVGHYGLPDQLDQWTLETSPIHRATIVSIRTYLTMLGEMLATGCSSVGITASSVHRR